MNQLQSAVHDIGGFESTTLDDGASVAEYLQLPQQGRRWAEIRAELVSRKSNDCNWRAGRLPIYVYHEDDELLAVSREAYGLYFSENALGRQAFPSLVRMEDEIVQMSLALFEAPPGACGSFTSGGTESIFLALKAARDRFKERVGDVKPNVVLPHTAHPAFDKAAHYLGVDVIRVKIGANLRVDVTEVKRTINSRTMLIVGSAPCYPFGVYDPIPELGELALARDVWLHVDACLGGFLAPFAREEGYPVPHFEFSVPGVTSLSADIHKFGFSARGASVLLYRESSLKAYQGFTFDNWPRGSYSTETFPGSRPGGTVASAWAVSQYLGRAGYRRLARKTMDAKRRLVAGVEAIPGLELIRPSELNVVLYRSNDEHVDIGAVADILAEKGWFIGRTREPRALHLALNPVHAPVVAEYLTDLEEAVQQARLTGRLGCSEDVTY